MVIIKQQVLQKHKQQRNEDTFNFGNKMSYSRSEHELVFCEFGILKERISTGCTNMIEKRYS